MAKVLAKVETEVNKSYRAEDLKHLENGMYSAVNDVGSPVTILRQKGLGWSIIKETHDGWFETVDYDENGDVECVSYSK